MKQWIALAIVLWLGSIGLIAAFTVQRLLEPKGEPVRNVNPNDEARIDDKPAYLMHAYSSSSVVRDETPAWRVRELYMVPRSEIPTGAKAYDRYWRAVAIDKPHHLMFVLPDGTRSGPHRVEFGEEGSAILPAPSGWSRNGKRFSLVSGYEGYPHDSELFEGRFWNRSVVQQFAMEQLVWVGVATGGAVVLIVVLGVIRLLRP